MKKFITLLVASYLTVSVFAQTAQTVTINFKGINNKTKNFHVKIDETSFYSNDNYGSSTGTLENLPVGKHLIKIYSLRSGNPKFNNVKNPLVYSKTFDLRAGYDMDIAIRPNGRVVFSEKIVSDPVVTVNVRTPMATAKFNQLVVSVKNKWSQALKGETIKDAFTDPMNYFSTVQVRQLLNLVNGEADRLDLAMLSYSGVTNVGDFQQLYDLFKSQASIDELNNFLRSKGWNINDNYQVGAKIAMSENNFNLLVQNVKNKWSQSLKGETVSEAFKKQNNYFRTAQVLQLLKLINSENDRVDLAKIAYPAVTDSSNFTQLYSLLSTQALRDELNAYLRTQGWKFQGDVTVRTTMSDPDFNALLQNVRNKWSQSLKGETINDAFRNSSNYFRVAQVNQLLTQITNEGDRLELAKMSYASIVDTLNFTQLYTLFPTQSSKDALNAFLRDRGWQIAVDVQGNVKTPMSSASFEQLVQNIKNNLLQILKVASIKNVLRDPNNYFSAQQVYQLVALINAEESRLEVAKLSYRSVVDRNNFPQVYNLLSTPASKNELAIYVRDYRE